MNTVLDLIIIGAGPAGMTAGIYASRRKLKTLIVSKDIGGQAAWSGGVENYLGFSMITGPELVKKFESHLGEFKEDLELRVVNTGVKKITKDGRLFSVELGDGSVEIARAVLIAGGRVPRELGVPGEKKFINRGITYCAWCDGPLFSSRDVAIIGGGNSALSSALVVADLANQIYIINTAGQLTGDPIMVDKIKDYLNIRVINNTRVVAIEGDKMVQSVRIKTEDGLQKDLPVSGVLIEIGSSPATDYLINLVKLNKDHEIIIDNNNATSVDGIFAAGDITSITEKQIITAAGEGAKAAIQVSNYLAKQK